MRRLVLLLILIVVAGCVAQPEQDVVEITVPPEVVIVTATGDPPTPVVVTATLEEPTPTREGDGATTTPEPTKPRYARDCRLPVGAFDLVNANPCLEGAVREAAAVAWTEGVVAQYRPETYHVRNRVGNGDGLVGAEHHTYPLFITEHDDVYVFAVGYVAGETALETAITLHEPVCLFVQAIGTYKIDDPDYTANRTNYTMRAYIGKQDGAEVDLGMVALPEATNGDLEPFWAVRVTEPGVYTVGVGVWMRYPTAPSGSFVALESIGIAENTDGGFCGEHTLDI